MEPITVKPLKAQVAPPAAPIARVSFRFMLQHMAARLKSIESTSTALMPVGTWSAGLSCDERVARAIKVLGASGNRSEWKSLSRREALPA